MIALPQRRGYPATTLADAAGRARLDIQIAETQCRRNALHAAAECFAKDGDITLAAAVAQEV